MKNISLFTLAALFVFAIALSWPLALRILVIANAIFLLFDVIREGVKLYHAR